MTTYTTVLDAYDTLTLWRSEGEDDPRPVALAALVNGQTVASDDDGVVFRAAAAVLAPDEAVVEAAAAEAWADFHGVAPDEFVTTAPSRTRSIYIEQTRIVIRALRQHAEGSAS